MEGDQPQQKTFLGNYLCKSLLGRGAFGTVHLVERGGESFALKLIEKERLSGENEHLGEYLKGEVACMKEMEEEHYVRLLDFQEDERFFYLLLEYCEGGDLLSLQVAQPDKVFPLAEALQLMSQVAAGLQALHRRGYLHRDIKPQNVLVKSVEGRRVLKLADFGFAKKASFVAGTIIGTEYFMSPEIYEQGMGGGKYGFEVDVWAFGVLLFYMLNSCFPFQIQPAWSCQLKFEELSKQASNFSYRQKVARTRKKLFQNCTDPVEHLFRSLFTLRREERITFEQIVAHPAFAPYFAEGRLLSSSELDELSLKEQGRFARERQVVALQMEEVDFPLEIAASVHAVGKSIGEQEALMFAYTLAKYHLHLLYRLASGLGLAEYGQRQDGLDWAGFFSSSCAAEVQRAIEQATKHGAAKLREYEEQCQASLGELCELNEHFGAYFKAGIRECGLEGEALQAYRCSINLVYQRVKEFLRDNKVLSFYCLLSQVCVCYIFSSLYGREEAKKLIFEAYLAREEQPLALFSYKRLQEYLRGCGKDDYVALAKRAIQSCSEP